MVEFGTRWLALGGARRRDGTALGFGIAFIVFGLLGVLRAAGWHIPSDALYATILLGLGAAALLGVFYRER